MGLRTFHCRQRIGCGMIALALLIALLPTRVDAAHPRDIPVDTVAQPASTDDETSPLYLPFVAQQEPSIRSGTATLPIADILSGWTPGSGPLWSFDVWKGEVVQGLEGDFWYYALPSESGHGTHAIGFSAALTRADAWTDYAEDYLPLDTYHLAPTAPYVIDNMDGGILDGPECEGYQCTMIGRVYFGKTNGRVTYFKFKIVEATNDYLTFDWIHQTNGSRDFRSQKPGPPLAIVERIPYTPSFNGIIKNEEGVWRRPGTDELYFASGRIIDAITGQTLRENAASSFIDQIAFRSDGSIAYIRGSSTFAITVFDCNSREEQKQLPVSTGPKQYSKLVLWEAGNILYYIGRGLSSDPNESRLFALHLDNGQLDEMYHHDRSLSGPFIVPELRELYVFQWAESNADNKILVFDLDTNKVKTFFSAGNLDSIKLSLDESRLYMTGQVREDGELYAGLIELDPQTKKVMGAFNFGGTGYYGYNFGTSGELLLSDDGRWAYSLACCGFDMLQFDLRNRTISNQIPLDYSLVFADSKAFYTYRNSGVMLRDGQTMVLVFGKTDENPYHHVYTRVKWRPK